MDGLMVTAAAAVVDVRTGSSIAVGFGGTGSGDSRLVQALHDSGVGDLRIVSDYSELVGWGLDPLILDGQVRRIIAQDVGDNTEIGRKYLGGELEVELTSHDTLVQRLRAGARGVRAFYAPEASARQASVGDRPWKHDTAGGVSVVSPRKDVRKICGASYILERGITTDFALIRAWKGDRHGNLIYRESDRELNSLFALSSRVTIAEVEELVEPEDLDPDSVHTPGALVHRLTVRGS
ncbi:CoA transferase subunit A [Paenarthrobacter histidinolovorans]|uniref:CoA transferase subunit A n=1 Tax=Paenarthrobacter histidinolovorans TaxID=43664 RepID=UPI001666FECC|nr:3-oxoacid CoA-transferase subunit A [Paenarthrobacter histidinolovorans]GGJ22085.1 putative succinyl-CoA:3-ketoacid coenzyme A transferase subunit A [Paenarthrobacter histidinolovorans]